MSSSRYQPYQPPRKDAPPMEIAKRQTWRFNRHRWVAFGALALEDVFAKEDRIDTSRHDPDYYSFKYTNSGTTYYRLKCTPLICGNLNCEAERHGHVLLNFPPPVWPGAAGYGGFNPFKPHPNHPPQVQNLGFYYWDWNTEGLEWNSHNYGDGPPDGWGVHTSAAAGDEQLGGDTKAVAESDVRMDEV